jgi:hypothetical protein
LLASPVQVADSRPAEPGSNDRPCDCTREFRLVSLMEYFVGAMAMAIQYCTVQYRSDFLRSAHPDRSISHPAKESLREPA